MKVTATVRFLSQPAFQVVFAAAVVGVAATWMARRMESKMAEAPADRSRPR